MRSVRDHELPEELAAIGSQALDVAAYRAYPALHPLATAIWGELGIETGCYHDIAFRTGDCEAEVRGKLRQVSYRGSGASGAGELHAMQRGFFVLSRFGFAGAMVDIQPARGLRYEAVLTGSCSCAAGEAHPARRPSQMT